MALFTIDSTGDDGQQWRSHRVPQLPKRYGSIYREPAKTTTTSSRTANDGEPEDSDSDDDYGGLPPPSQDITEIINSNVTAISNRKKKMDALPGFTDDTEESGSASYRIPRYGISSTAVQELGVTDVQRELHSAVLTPAIEKQENLAMLSMSDRKVKELNRQKRAKTKGSNWFDLPAQEMTDELKNELDLIRMRSALDPKHFYKRSEMKALPKHFEVGKVLESPLEYYNERGPKKAKTQTLVDELLADAEFKKYNKRKYAEALEKRKKKIYQKAAIKMKKLKKKKK